MPVCLMARLEAISQNIFRVTVGSPLSGSEKAVRKHQKLQEAIRDRKQREKESFDTFYDNIVALMDELEMPLSEKSTVEILRRN